MIASLCRLRKSVATLDVAPGEEQALHQLHDLVENDADDRQVDEHGKHQRRIEVALRGDDERAQPAIGADILTHDGADHGERDRDPQSSEDDRQGVRNAQLEESLPAAGGEHAEQLDLIRIDRGQPDDGVLKQGEEADQCGDDHLRSYAEAEPDHHDRCQRKLGHRLRGEDVGIEDRAHERALGRDRSEHDADHAAEQESQQDLGERNPEMHRQEPVHRVLDERVPHLVGGRQHQRREPRHAHIEPPCRQHRDEHGERQQGLAEPRAVPRGLIGRVRIVPRDLQGRHGSIPARGHRVFHVAA